MPDAYSYTVTIVLPELDARAIATMCTGIDPGPNGIDTEALAGEHVGRVAESAVRDLIRRSADFRPLSASVTYSTSTTDPNPVYPNTNGDPV